MTASVLSCVEPEWPAPECVKSISTTRRGGCSQGPWAGLNLGAHVDDKRAAVEANRCLLIRQYSMPNQPIWLEQVHGDHVAYVTGQPTEPLIADAVWTDSSGVVLSIMTADCLPILFTARSAGIIAAVHAGWKGLASGIVQKTVSALPIDSRELIAWLGPAIGPDHFEVGSEVRDRFLAADPSWHCWFRQSDARDGKFFADLFGLARASLRHVGVLDVYGGGICTFTDQHRFYSYRRDSRRHSGSTGRMASLIWMDN